MFDFLDTDWLDGLGDAASSAPVDVGNSIGDAVGAAYGYNNELAPVYDALVSNPALGDALSGYAASPSSDGMTGIGWIDKILGGLKNQWDKDPLSTIGAGVALLGKIDQINQMRGGKPFIGGHSMPGTMIPGSADAQRLVSGLDAISRSNSDAGGAAYRSMAGQLPTNVQIPIMPAPTVRDPSLFIQQGALSRIKG